MQWFSKSRSSKGGVGEGKEPIGGDANQPRLAVAHFMLGNTYPFTEQDWMKTFDLAEDTALDGLALNIGPEEWQLAQACTAYRLLSASNHTLKLFLSLDLMVLPKDPELLVGKIVKIVQSGQSAQLKWDKKILLSTFGGHDLGDDGWREVLSGFKNALGEKVFFIPSFFLPPEEILKKDYVDGAYHWNGAWPMDNSTTTLDSDRPFLDHKKPYMASVSPLFFTHYGTEGEWAFNKNWIYRSDDLLLPRRFSQLLSLPPDKSPQMIQAISWNDFGESHYIGPILGAQPGSESWTEGMDHEGFRLITKYYIQQWKTQMSGTDSKEKGRLIVWYRTQSRDMVIAEDRVGKPDHAEWAQDLLNFFIVLPESKYSTKDHYNLHVQNAGEPVKPYLLNVGVPNLIHIHFKLGEVFFKVMKNNEEVVIEGEGKDIAQGGRWNYNMWTGVYDAK
uniref:Glycoside hydrolase family 71 protein n=1 Tax=Kwoniella dejecticola CBS 10117 TaxID=1296121 RepID=A0A1A6A344_9TREE|nr:uncharacterized protein I303_05333 [Kwoniella dejecticola CBS 10117]OBR84475.1 hypothetical protein I303_05333 [Kwoniella dejecticola CBS 10117]